MQAAWAVIEDGVVTDAHEADRQVPWWSFTKTVIAAAALALVRDGVLSLDARLPGRPYTLRHLLQHRAGLTDYSLGEAGREYQNSAARGDDPWPIQTLLNRTDSGRLRYPAGEGWEYSNIGYLFVRQLIESSTGQDLNTALKRLVLIPLGLENPRVALERADLDDVVMGDAGAYHPGWVYHGLMVGSVTDAAILLERLTASGVLPAELLTEMFRPLFLSVPIEGRIWTAPGYGLGVMTGQVGSDAAIAGHTGAGPGSTIAVYRCTRTRGPRSVAFFAKMEDQARTEEEAVRLLTR
jgi:CubicO group peptidase (beta-lactamase class C family)